MMVTPAAVGRPSLEEGIDMHIIGGMTAALVLAAAAAAAEEPAAYADIEATLGQVPSMFQVFPEAGIDGAWAEFKGLQLNPDSALDGKTKELLGLAVSAQIPCAYCVYFHTAAAKANGASEEEIREAVAMAAIVRHWSTVLNGMQVDPATFRAEVDALTGGADAAQASQ
jgi:AhpD family alkylhydroperoxidase